MIIGTLCIDVEVEASNDADLKRLQEEISSVIMKLKGVEDCSLVDSTLENDEEEGPQD